MEAKYNPNHHAGGTPEARISARLRNSGGDNADVCVQKGSGPTRVFHNIHLSGGQHGLHHTAEQRREAAPREMMKEKENDE
jgi:hypothetical protein